MKATNFTIGFFFLAAGLAFAQDASDVQAALQKAREKQSPPPSDQSTPPPKKPASTSAGGDQSTKPKEIEIPTYHPGRSRLYQISELSGLMGQGRLSDSWVYGKFTVLNGGPGTGRGIGAVPAGAMTGATFGSLLGVQYKPSICTIGWLCKDSQMPPIHQNTVIIISASSPAALVKVDMVQGYVSPVFNMVTPPQIEK